MITETKFNGTFDNRKDSCREWWLNGQMIYWQSAALIEEMGRTVFGAFPDLPVSYEVPTHTQTGSLSVR